MAFLVINTKDGRRAWYRQTDTIINKYGEVEQVPRFDDERGKEVSVTFAIDAGRAWKSYCLSVFNSDLQIVHEKYGQPFEVGGSPSTQGADARQKHFVRFSNGLGLYVTPGHNADGEAWFVRAADIPAFVKDSRHTVIESVNGKTPQEASQRAVDSWGQNILFRDPEEIAREIQERNRAAEQRSYTPGIRPGDRR